MPRLKGSRPAPDQKWYDYILQDPTRPADLSDKQYARKRLEILAQGCRLWVEREHLRSLITALNHSTHLDGALFRNKEKYLNGNNKIAHSFDELMMEVQGAYSALGAPVINAMGEALENLRTDPVCASMLEVFLGQMPVFTPQEKKSIKPWGYNDQYILCMDFDALVPVLRAYNLFPEVVLDGHEKSPDRAKRMKEALHRMAMADPTRQAQLQRCFEQSGGINQSIARWLQVEEPEFDEGLSKSARSWLEKNKAFCIQNMNLSELCPKLIEQKLLTQDQINKIDSEFITQEQKSEAVLNLLNNWLVVDSSRINDILTVFQTTGSYTGHDAIQKAWSQAISQRP